jgi:[acyl-carrier-protein] S-malonyltransferase
MGKADAAASSKAAQLFQQADSILGFSLSQFMFEGPEEKLKDTSVTQPALFTTSAAAFERLKEKGIHTVVVAGHSLGEYSALYAAGVLTFENALKLVQARGKAMQEAAQAHPGAMAAIIGLKSDAVKAICDKINAGGEICNAANFNSDSQTVIAGTVAGVNKAVEEAKAAGAAKAILLNVAGAFHSALMTPAAEKMKGVIESVSFADATIPVITNVDAQATTKAVDFKRKLVEQIDHSVRWDESARAMLPLADSFIEVGAGKVLSSMIKRLDRSKTVLWTDDFEAILTPST